ncbi:MAG: hypothetical protein GXZ15_04945 [Campylobacter sp.]|nr:hypothetical protein [Campylobacter sp.]
MSKLVVIADRNLCLDIENGYSKRVEEFLEQGAKVVLRQKDLSYKEYYEFAKDLLVKFTKFESQIYPHNYSMLDLGAKNLWLPFKRIGEIELSGFREVVVSVHSISEVEQALDRGATSLCLSHIYKTKSKEGLEPKGEEFISLVRAKFKTQIQEIYALGGIDSQNFRYPLKAGASYVCSMNAAMKCQNVEKFISSFC